MQLFKKKYCILYPLIYLKDIIQISIPSIK